MNVYLLRHAIAEERDAKKYPDDDRPLTKEGMRKMELAANGIASVVGNVDAILTSPLIRARQTAEIAARALTAEKKIAVCTPLSPGGWAESVISLLASRKQDDSVLLVGHEPDLGLLASALVGAPHGVVAFRKGSLCCVRIDGIPGQARGVIDWHLTPKQLRTLG